MFATSCKRPEPLLETKGKKRQKSRIEEDGKCEIFGTNSRVTDRHFYQSKITQLYSLLLTLRLKTFQRIFSSEIVQLCFVRMWRESPHICPSSNETCSPLLER